MDPNTALVQLRAAMACAARHIDDDTDDRRFHTVPNGIVLDAMEAFEALDGWLKSGGFLPNDWADVNDRT